MAKQGLHGDWAGQLLAWYDIHRRDLPWRAKSGRRADPYHVWLSEIMLQQTRVAAATVYFEKFLVLWPTVHDLAAASLDDVLRAWAGLGYYARARNLHACARVVTRDLGGLFPETEEALRALPGIGPYTAAAIAAIAFDQPRAAVDGNVERMISRLHAIETPLPDSKLQIRDHAQALIPGKRAGDFAQAMMDLGATICTPRSPDCKNCPWAEHCAGRWAGIAASFPRRKPKAPTPTRHGTAFWIEREDGAVLLRRRPERGLLGGMMEVPSTEWTGLRPRNAEALAPVRASWRKVTGKVEHTFTHFHLELSVLKARLVTGGEVNENGDYRWVPRRDLPSEALPTVMRKVVALVLH
jgi:A/G-specific adenine glycosylase